MHDKLAFLVALSFAGSGICVAQELRGAKLSIEDATASNGEIPATQESLALMNSSFIKASEGMSTGELVAGWLKILDLRLKIGTYVREEPFVALPPVEAWSDLAAELDKRVAGKTDARSRGQWLLASLLRGDEAELKIRVETLRKAWADNEDMLGAVDTFAAARWQGGDGSEVEAFQKSVEEGSRYHDVPDLTTIPRQEAEKLLLTAMEKAARLTFLNPETRKIALEALEKNPNLFKNIPWAVFAGPEDGPFIEARLPEDFVLPKDDYAAREGLAHYFNYLVGKRDFAKADKIRKLYPRNDIYHLTDRSLDEMDAPARSSMRDYLLGTLREDASQPFWMEIGSLATSEDAEVWKLFREAIDQDRLSTGDDRRYARVAWLDHLFENGKEVEAMRYLEKFIEGSSGEELQSLLTKQVRVATLLDDRATTDKALDRLEAGAGRTGVNSELVSLEMERGRFAQLEKIAVEWLRNAKPRSWSQGGEAAVLVRIYDAAGKPDDVLAMLDSWPKWGTSDLSLLVSSGLSDTGLCAARALAAKGRNAEAVDLLKGAIKVDPAEDSFYAELLKIAPADCEPYLLELAGKFPFEERPLIWLAKWYADAGRLDEGETTIRKAIAIDPSDGDTGKGDRMRAYRVLGEIQRKQGKVDEAEFMAKIAKAIRLSEDADDWWEAGMNRRAMAMYDQALAIFSDAYCIQSRLALRYDHMGDTENALKHYQRAFELMPDSFGRIESHCFGCEGAFSSPSAQGVAERIFTAMAEKPDAKAQVFYLLGNLRDSQDRYKEAAVFFRKAVEKDPDYVNALAKLSEREEENGLTREERDRITARLVFLSGDRDPGNILDLRLMWQAALEKDRRSVWLNPKVPLYPLAASAAEEKAAAELRTRGGGDMDGFPIRPRNGRAGRESIASHPLIQPIVQMLVSEE